MGHPSPARFTANQGPTCPLRFLPARVFAYPGARRPSPGRETYTAKWVSVFCLLGWSKPNAPQAHSYTAQTNGGLCRRRSKQRPPESPPSSPARQPAGVFQLPPRLILHPEMRGKLEGASSAQRNLASCEPPARCGTGTAAKVLGEMRHQGAPAHRGRYGM